MPIRSIQPRSADYGVQYMNICKGSQYRRQEREASDITRVSASLEHRFDDALAGSNSSLPTRTHRQHNNSFQHVLRVPSSGGPMHRKVTGSNVLPAAEAGLVGDFTIHLLLRTFREYGLDLLLRCRVWPDYFLASPTQHVERGGLLRSCCCCALESIGHLKSIGRLINSLLFISKENLAATAMGLVTPIVERAMVLANHAGNLAWPPLLSLARGTILSLFRQIQLGSLQITDTDGSLTICGSPLRGDPDNEKGVYTTPHAEFRVLNDLFWIRLLVFADMGFAESYMLGEVDCPDLVAFFKVFIVNRPHLSNGTTFLSNLSGKLASLVRSTNTLTNARLNISAHYDISNDMFAAFLSPDMTYSCPIWLPKSNAMSSQETLEQAQYRKLCRFVANAKIKATDHVLEIGTGWGSFAILAVEKTGCRVTSLTLSAEQKTLAEDRIRRAGFQDKIKVLLCDYRSLPVPREQDKYDKVVSIEMLEAVGAEFLETYFRCIDQLLKTDGGVAVFQCITMPESRYEVYSKSDDFIRRYIFPGGHLPTITQLLDAIRAGSSTKTVPPRLIPESIENIGPHYAKTLRLWRQSFMQSFNSKIRSALVTEYAEKGKKMSEDDIELFKRKWEYYFAYCEAGFATKTLGDVILTVGREGAVQMMEDVPL